MLGQRLAASRGESPARLPPRLPLGARARDRLRRFPREDSGLGVPGRLVVHRERDAVRPAVLMAAPPGAETTPPGGLAFPDHQARPEIADGLLAVRSTTSWTGNAMVGHIDAFCAAAAAVIGESQPSPGATRGTLSV
jgi:hypothetical protein